MADMRIFPDSGMDRSGQLTSDQQEVLRRAVAKVVVLGEHVGVSADEMIRLLEDGLTVRELLEYLLSQQTNLA